MNPLAEVPDARLQPVRGLVLDVDGVLTDGGIVYGSLGEGADAEILRFHVRDGAGIAYWRRAGHRVALLSGRGSPMVRRRAAELGIDAIRLSAKDKLPAFHSLCEELGLAPADCAYLGDDLPDLPPMRAAGLAIAVADAASDVRLAADGVTAARGGEGAVRETVETILRAQKRWDALLSSAVQADDGKASSR